MKTIKPIGLTLGLVLLSAAYSCSSLPVSPDPPENLGSKNHANNYVVQYDFGKGLYNAEKNTVKPKVHYPVVFRIKNINRYAYDIEVKSRDSILAFSFSLDDLPKEIFAGEKKATQLSAQESVADDKVVEPPKPVTVSDLKVEDDDSGELVEILNSGLKSIELDRRIAEYTVRHEKTLNKIRENAIALNYAGDSEADVQSELGTVEMELRSFEEIPAETRDSTLVKSKQGRRSILIEQLELVKARDEIASLKGADEAERSTLRWNLAALTTFTNDNQRMSVLFAQFRQAYREVKEVLSCYDQLHDLITNHQLTFDVAQLKLEKFRKEQDKLASYRIHLANLRLRYYDLQIQYEILKRNHVLNDKLNEYGEKKLYGQADDLMNRAKKMFEKIDVDTTEKKIGYMPMIIESLSKNDTFEWISAPIEPIGDVVNFYVDIKAKNKTKDKLLNERKFKHQEFTYGGTRIDFGLGLASSFFDKTRTYELQVKQVNALSQISIQEKDSKLVVPSLVGLVTMSHRSSSYTCFGGSAGLGIDVVNGKIQLSNFFAGPSVTFGRYERLTFTTGATFRNVQQLKSGYEIGSVVSGGDTIDNYLTDKYKIGFFASLTFVLTKGVKDNLKQLPSYR